MDKDLQQYLEGMEQRLDASTHQHLEAMEQRLDSKMDQHLEAMEQRILDRTQEMVRDAQTEILRGFERYQTGAQIRFRSLEAETSNLKTAQELRLANLEERVLALELKQRRDRPSGAA